MCKELINRIRQEDYTPDTVKLAVDKINEEMDLGVPVEIVRLCRSMGFSIFRQKLPSLMCGYIAVDGELKDRLGTDRIIVVNGDESSKRRRFTVAHELAHFLFDFDPNEIEFYNAFETNHNVSNDPKEIRASRFAAELLMPVEEFTEAYNKAYTAHERSSERFYETVQDLSDIFLVPPKAVEVRIKEELKLSDELPAPQTHDESRTEEDPKSHE